jgi:hypothetical protein
MRWIEQYATKKYKPNGESIIKKGVYNNESSKRIFGFTKG